MSDRWNRFEALARSAYRLLPRRLRGPAMSVLFSTVPFMFSGTSAYRYWKLGRTASSDVRPTKLRAIENFEVFYVSGLPGRPSHHYRVDNQVEAFNRCGIAAGWISSSHVAGAEQRISASRLVILFRVVWDESVAALIAACRANGTPVLFDIDDYVFEPEIADESIIDGIRFLSDFEKASYIDGVRRYRRTLEECDGVIATTRFLGDRAAELGKRWCLLPNGFSAQTQRQAEEAAAATAERDGAVVRIGYASGSKTHQQDFAVASRAIARLMADRAEVVLTVVGDLDLAEFTELAPFAARVERRPLVRFEDLPNELARFDINIAPLVVGNPFCEAKSELKYYEAALVRVPTVASATGVFATAIEDGVGGFVVADEASWYAALSELARNPPLRRSMAEVAYAHARNYYGPEESSRRAGQLFEVFAGEAQPDYPAADERVAMLLPEMSHGSGGHSKAISLARALSKEGFRVSLVFTRPTPDYPTPLSISRAFNLRAAGITVHISESVQFDADVAIATYWTTVPALLESPGRFRVRAQLLQDYEPYFFPMGTDYLRSLATLHEPLVKISYGPWIRQTIAHLHDLSAMEIPFYIDHRLYRPPPSGAAPRRRQIVFLARPEMPRRCFDLGVEVLSSFQRRYGSDTEIVLFGSKLVRERALPFRFRDLGVVPPAELADLYQHSAVGLIFSPTNPSMVPFEMMACGLPVVDLDVGGNEVNYGGRHNVTLAPPRADDIADAIARLLHDDEARGRVAAAGQKFAAAMADEASAVSAFVGVLRSELDAGLADAAE